MNDFNPGDTIFYNSAITGRKNGPFIVLDPVRTKAGKLRLKGPKGGLVTTWWSGNEKHNLFSNLKVISKEPS